MSLHVKSEIVSGTDFLQKLKKKKEKETIGIISFNR
jgi:hypothetical protein